MARMPPRRTPGAAALGTLCALAALGAGLVFAVAVHTGTGQRLDDAAFSDAPFADAPRAYAATQRLLDTISVSSLALFGLGIMCIALLRRRPALAIGAGIVVLGANITTQTMKAYLERPDLVTGTAPDTGAFPSGHVTVAMSLAMALVLVTPAALRWTATLAGWAYASGVGVAVIALDWHRPSEVVGAYLVSVAWTAGVAAVVLARDTGRREDADPRAARLGAAAATILGLAFAAVVGASAGRRLDVVRIVDDRTAFALAALVGAIVCAALCATVATLMQRAQVPSSAGTDR